MSENIVSASVSGRVTDLNNMPIGNANVTAGNVATVTDANGNFTIKNVQLDKEAGLVKVTTNGYFNGLRTFITNPGAVNNVRIQLIPKRVSGNFSTSSGENVNVAGGGSVDFPANSFVNAKTNSVYSGDVSISTFYLNPAASNFTEMMPGDLRGINTSNQQSVLKIYGMSSVEMSGAAGEKLQISANKTAVITIPIANNLQPSAPASLPLWYFDETTGFWKQQGVATKQGNNYVGTVSHFSFWASGQLAESIKLTATFQDSSGARLANNLVTITSVKFGSTDVYTDSSGAISSLVPAGDSLRLELFNQNIPVYNQTVGPFSTDSDLGILIVKIPAVSDSEYIRLSFNEQDYLWSPADSLSAARIDTSGYHMIIEGGMQASGFFSPSQSVSLWFASDNTTPGIYPDCTIALTLNYAEYVGYGNSPPETISTNVTEYGAVGGYVTGTCSGQLTQEGVNSNGQSFPFSMSYRIRRSQ